MVATHENLPDRGIVEKLQRSLGLSRIVATLLAQRGLETPEEAREFLEPSLERDWADPLLIPQMEEGARVVFDAVKSDKHIVVFGDFDCDGISATAVLTRGLRAFGARVTPLIPRRLDEGYGLSDAALERILAEKPDLVVTVDNGISGGREIEALKAAGVAVVVTDHHEPGAAVPAGVPVLDPKMEDACPSRDLAGVGVALKLVQVLGGMDGQPGFWRTLTDIATLGTVADQMSLLGENRALVADGIALMHTDPRPFISAFVTLSTRKVDLSAEGLSFSLLPRINSAGRMGDPTVALDLLMADTLEEATECMQRLEEVNEERRTVEARVAEEAIAKAEESYKGERAIVLGAPGWHEGVKGIVATRIAGRFGVPAILFDIEDGEAHGSGRSVGSVNLLAAVEACKSDLVRYGGHEAALGVTCAADKLDDFRAHLCEALDKLPAEDFICRPAVDMDMTLGEASLSVYDDVQRLAPFGQDNPVPVFRACSVFLDDRRRIGKPPVHFSAQASDGSAQVRCIYFNPANLDALVACDTACDLTFKLERNEYRGTCTPQLMLCEVDIHASGAGEDVGSCAQGAPADEDRAFLEGLFEQSESTLDRSDYAGILDADSFATKIAGVTFEGRQELLARIRPDVDLALVREPDNAYDACAIAVCCEAGQLGYLNTRLAARMAPALDEGASYTVRLSEITGGSDGKNLGANIIVEKEGLESKRARAQADLAAARAKWEQVPADALPSALREALIGKSPLHDAQARSLDNLIAGHSTLTVMATGRGKSLIFHLHAARVALEQHKASVFIYPLRALVADQAYHLSETFEDFGLVVQVITGETAEGERDRIFDALAKGKIDVLLTTPEFLSIHSARFAATGRIAFLVVDEAHHIGMARSGNRPAYANLHDTRAALGNPVALAVTATASTDVAQTIIDSLGIEKTVLDPSLRENLHIADERDVKDRESRLAHLVAAGGKTVIYVNSRDQTIKLARMLRRRVPERSGRIAFYNAGLSRDDRARVEASFRDGLLDCIVSTSAFGEGVNIPDIAHVVLFHLPFNEVEFNQMAGRAGRDGRDAFIHLLFGRGDARINEKILSSQAPSRDDMVTLYRILKRRSHEAGDEFFSATNAEMNEEAVHLDSSCRLSETGVSCGIAVFRELGFVQSTGYGSARRLHVLDTASKVELTQSIRYLEGLEEIEEFSSFRDWALGARADDLLARFNRPILP